MRHSRFEIVRNDTGWHARFIASNGRIVWWTETYERRRGAVRAIELIDDALWSASGIRDVDERTRR